MAEKAPSATWKSGFQSWNHWSRFATLTVIIVACIAAATWISIEQLHESEVDVEFKGHSVLFHQRRQDSKAVLLLPSNQLWYDTNLDVEPDEEVQINASGSVNLAIHRVVEAANAKETPRHPWVRPDGSSVGPPLRSANVDENRRKLLLSPEAPYGAVLACFVIRDEKAPGVQNLRPQGVKIVKEGATLLQDRASRARLWLTVNDEVIDPSNLPSSRQAFVSTVDEIMKRHKEMFWFQAYLHKCELARRFDEEIVPEGVWDINYQDNVGEYLVQIAIPSSHSVERRHLRLAPEWGSAASKAALCLMTVSVFAFLIFLFFRAPEYEPRTYSDRIEAFAILQSMLVVFYFLLWYVPSYFRLMCCLFGWLATLLYGCWTETRLPKFSRPFRSGHRRGAIFFYIFLGWLMLVVIASAGLESP